MKKPKIHIKIPKVLPRNPAALPAKMRHASSMTNRNEKRIKEQETFDVEDVRMTCEECYEESIYDGDVICISCCLKDDFCLTCGESSEDDYYKDICSLCQSLKS